jgi:hypothetical protein
MDKTLDGMQLVHRLIMALTLAMVVLGCSIQPPPQEYKAASDEIDYLGKVLKSMDTFRTVGYQALYKDSELRLSFGAWLASHKSKQKTINIITIDPDGIAEPDPTVDPHITVEQEVVWVDSVFSQLYIPFVTCTAKQQDIFAALDTAFPDYLPTFESIIVKVRSKEGKPAITGPWTCSLLAKVRHAVGPVSTIEFVDLKLSTQALETNSEVGPNGIELDAADWLKEQGFGDFEDNIIAPIPSIRGLWSDLRTQDVSDVKAFLDQRSIAESKRSEQKIEILGQPLNGALSTMLLSILTVLTLMYFATLATHARGIAEGNERALTESPLLGLLNHWAGRVVILCTIFVLPLIATTFDLIFVFPRFREQWSGPKWIASSPSRWICIGTLVLTAVIALFQMTRTMLEIRRRASLAYVPE